MSEDSHVKELSSTKDLIWKETGIEYGNWYSGKNKDGSIEFHHTVQTSKVTFLSGTWKILFYVILGASEKMNAFQKS